MENNYYVCFFKNILKKKFIYIFIIGILSALVCSGVKLLFSDIATRTGSYFFTRTVQVFQNQVRDDFDYKGFLESPANYYQFVKEAEKGDFDFTKVDSAWGRKSETEQMDWLRQHIQVANYRGNVISITIYFDANITRDVNYMSEHGLLLTNDFVKQSQKSIRTVIPDATFKVINEEQATPVITPIDRKKVAIKFAIIGFLVGIIGAAICFYLWSIAKEYRKSIE